MNDIPEPAKKIQRLMFPLIIAGLIGVIAYAVSEQMSPAPEEAAPGEERNE
jgi:hypothetical protein